MYSSLLCSSCIVNTHLHIHIMDVHHYCSLISVYIGILFNNGFFVNRKASVNIMECTSCKRKFATQLNSDADTPMCKHCRLCLQATSSSVDAVDDDDDSFDDAPKEDTSTPTTTTTTTTQHLEAAASSSGSSSVASITLFPTPPVATVVSSDTQTSSSSKSDRRVTMPPASCKLCRSKFRYRMCLVRHLKTNHKDVIDLNNLHSYISYDSDDSISKVYKASFSEGEDIVEANFSITSDRSNSISGMDPDNDSLKDGAADASLASIDTSYDLTSGLDFDPEKTSSMIVVDDSLKRRFVCHLCKKSFDRQYRLKRHLQVHNPNRPKIKCDLCSKSFTRQDSLEAHVKAAHSKLRPYVCTYEGCNKAYSNSSQLLQHSRLHTGGKPYQCNFCDKSFAFANEHKEHIRDVHIYSNSHKCSYCHKVYSTEEELSLHKTKEHRVECEVCNKTFSRLAYLEVHVKVHEGDGKFNCSSCFKSFDNESNYRQHIKSHPDYKPYGCQVCNVSFSHPSNLINHQKAMHGYDPANDSSGSNAQEPVDLTGINLSQNCSIVQEDGTGNNDMCLP